MPAGISNSQPKPRNVASGRDRCRHTAIAEIASRQQLALARQLRQVIATYNQSRDLVTLGAWRPGANPQLDQAVALWPAVQRFLDQDLGERADFGASLAALGELLAGGGAGPENRE